MKRHWKICQRQCGKTEKEDEKKNTQIALTESFRAEFRLQVVCCSLFVVGSLRFFRTRASVLNGHCKSATLQQQQQQHSTYNQLSPKAITRKNDEFGQPMWSQTIMHHANHAIDSGSLPVYPAKYRIVITYHETCVCTSSSRVVRHIK